MSEVDETAVQLTEMPAVAAGSGGLDVQIAQELIERARTEGLSLVGQGGLLQQVTRQVKPDITRCFHHVRDSSAS